MSIFSELKRRNVIRVGLAYLAVAWLLIQIADTVFPAYGLAESVLQVLITALAIGFLPTLVIAWVFELTPQGLKRDSEVVRTEGTTQKPGKKLDRVILVVLALALGYFAFDKFILDPARDVEIAQEAADEARAEAIVGSFGEKSIAVLAFADLSPEGDQGYFSDGISEELLNLLAKIPGLRVAGRTSRTPRLPILANNSTWPMCSKGRCVRPVTGSESP
jgi:hypothetical protein